MPYGGCRAVFVENVADRTAAEIDAAIGRLILTRLRHEGRKLTEVYVLTLDGAIDRYQERTRRKLGSNAVASRTWLCETAEGDQWGNGRYIPEPSDAIDAVEPQPEVVVLVLNGAEGVSDNVIEQLGAHVTAK